MEKGYFFGNTEQLIENKKMLFGTFSWEDFSEDDSLYFAQKNHLIINTYIEY